MKKVMLIGEWRSGKSALIRALSEPGYMPRKVLALDFYRNFVNTPSEFLENRRYQYHNLNRIYHHYWCLDSLNFRLVCHHH